MTPFGERIRILRAERKVTLTQMADAIGVSAAYLSALEHGRRSRPSWYLVQRILAYFNIIWDEAEDLVRLANLSHPRMKIDTGRLPSTATALVNQLAANIHHLSKEEISRISLIIEGASKKSSQAKKTQRKTK